MGREGEGYHGCSLGTSPCRSLGDGKAAGEEAEREGQWDEKGTLQWFLCSQISTMCGTCVFQQPNKKTKYFKKREPPALVKGCRWGKLDEN